jgi:glycosidase
MKTIYIFTLILLIGQAQAANIIDYPLGKTVNQGQLFNLNVLISPFASDIPGAQLNLTPNRSWLYDGPIYETHPYYYPNHSFKEITEQVPSLADLGVKTIYLMPIWEQPPGDENYSSIYHTYDYYKINQVYGTPQELKELINIAHENNIKVLFDLVTCCTWKGNIIWNKNGTFSILLSQLQKKAIELGWTLEHKTINGDKYLYYNCSTRNHKTLCDFAGKIVDDKVILLQYPQVGNGFAIDRTNPEMINYFTEVATYYVMNYDIDGWRVDDPTDNWNPDVISGDHSSQELLRSIKREITKVKPDAILISEWPTVEKTKPSELSIFTELDEEAEASYSYYFYYRLGEIVRGKKLFDVIGEENISFNRTRIRFSESHDTYQRMNKIVPQLNKPLTVLISTVTGIPMIQAGQEIGAKDEFFTNPQVDWGHGDYELRKFYKKVFEIRNNNDALKYGSLKSVWNSGDNIYAYLRSYNDENVVIIISFVDTEAVSKFDVSFLNTGTILYDALNEEQFIINDPNNLEISVPAHGSRILILKK